MVRVSKTQLGLCLRKLSLNDIKQRNLHQSHDAMNALVLSTVALLACTNDIAAPRLVQNQALLDA